MTDRGRHSLEAGAEIAPGRTVLRKLGGGNRYEVFLVWDDERFSLLVAKVLRPGAVEDPEALEDLREEAEALASLAHPVILRGFGAVLDGPFPHLALEHLEGPSLRSLVKADGALDLQQLLPLGLHVAAGLHYMAGAGWVHLDIKPDNLIMGVPPRIIDLSIARTVERAGRTRGILGTDAYMAPEQCGAPDLKGRIGPASDVFGLAATLWHAATGSVPFPRAEDDRFPQLHTDPPPPPPRMPGALAELLHAGLARDPSARPSAAEMATGLEPLVGTLPRRPRFGRGRR